MMNTNLIVGRRQAYALCSAEALSASREDLKYGDLKCAAKNQSLALFYWWAQDVMARTPIEGDGCTDCMCVSDELACEVIQLMDPGCVVCGCGDPSDRPINCDVQAPYAVAAAVDASFQDLAQLGQSYLIVSDLDSSGNEWASHLGEIVYNSAYTVPAEGEPIYNVLNLDYWVVVGGSAYPYFPRVDAVRDGFDIDLTSRAPQVNAFFDRTIVIRVSADATNWIGVYVGSEQDIPASVTVTIDDALYVDVTYLTQDDYCRYGPFYGTVEAAQAPFATKSILFNAVSVPFLNTVLPGKLDILPWDEPKWFISNNIKIAGVQEAGLYCPITLGANVANGSTPYTGANFNMDGIIYLGNFELALNVTISGSGGPVFNTTIVFPGAKAAMTTGTWRYVSVKRDSADAGVMAGPDFTMTLSDGTTAILEISGVVASSSAPSYTTPVGLSYDTTAASNQTIGDFIALTSEDYTLNNIYIAKYAPSPAEIAAVSYPALYSGNDSTWNRVLWIRAEPPDSISASPWVNGNVTPDVDWKDAQNIGITLVQDKPDWVQ